MGFFFQSKSEKEANKLQKEANQIAQNEYELEKATSEWNQDYTMNQYLYTSQDMANAGLNPLMALSNGASSSQASTTSGGSGGSTSGSPSALSDLTAMLSPILGFVSQAKNRSNSVSMNNARIDAQKDISDASLVNQSLIALLDRQSREKIADDSQPIQIGSVKTTKGVLRDAKDLVSEYLPKSGSTDINFGDNSGLSDEQKESISFDSSKLSRWDSINDKGQTAFKLWFELQRRQGVMTPTQELFSDWLKANWIKYKK